MLKYTLWMFIIIFTSPVMALESTEPPHPITTLQIATQVLKKLYKNAHIQVIGSCFWLESGPPPKVKYGPAISQFLPDLIVTVSNNPSENPWVEVNTIYEDEAAQSLYQSAFEKALNFPLGFGDGTGQIATQHINEDRTRIVSVIGSPSDVYKIKGLTHAPETSFMKLYYSSLVDAVNERFELGEIAYMASHPNLLMNHDIGSSTYIWGHEIPRLMRITQPSRFRASVVAAMHAADIVTNDGMHIKIPTSNSCGPNCVVANVVFDPREEQVIWQEIYPMNRNIIPGSGNDFGIEDEKRGNGNYIFVVWRKYKGCVRQKGEFLWGFPLVGEPQKR
jgi:integrating conjugative element protein (TIGR03756 family)